MANERLKQLRALMAQHGMDAYYIPSSDFHDSEYVDPYFKCREFISGFTGSAGTMVVTKDFSGLWTDGRYFVQAKKQLEGQDTELMKMGEENVPTIDEFLMEHLPEGGVLGMDGRVVNTGIGRSFEKLLKVKRVQPPLSMIWQENSGPKVRSFRLPRSGCWRRNTPENPLPPRSHGSARS